MGDNFETVVDVDATEDKAASLADTTVRWMVGRGIQPGDHLPASGTTSSNGDHEQAPGYQVWPRGRTMTASSQRSTPPPPRWATGVAWAVPVCVLPSTVWRTATAFDDD